MCAGYAPAAGMTVITLLVANTAYAMLPHMMHVQHLHADSVVPYL